MKTEFIEKIKKNTILTKAEKKELIAFWTSYECPIAESAIIRAVYHDGEIKDYTVGDRLNHFHDETPDFINSFFYCMSQGKEFRSRFGTYKALPVS